MDGGWGVFGAVGFWHCDSQKVTFLLDFTVYICLFMKVFTFNTSLYQRFDLF